MYPIYRVRKTEAGSQIIKVFRDDRGLRHTVPLCMFYKEKEIAEIVDLLNLCVETGNMKKILLSDAVSIITKMSDTAKKLQE